MQYISFNTQKSAPGLPATLLDTKMRVDLCITSSSSQIFFVGNVLVSLRISVLTTQPKVNKMHDVSRASQAHQKVIRLDVTMSTAFRM